MERFLFFNWNFAKNIVVVKCKPLRSESVKNLESWHLNNQM